MIRVHDQAGGLVLPAWTDVFIGGKAVQRLASLRAGIGPQDAMQRRVQMVLGRVVRRFHGGCCARAVHPLPWTMAPGMRAVGEAEREAIRLADAIAPLVAGVMRAVAARPLQAARAGRSGPRQPRGLPPGRTSSPSWTIPCRTSSGRDLLTLFLSRLNRSKACAISSAATLEMSSLKRVFAALAIVPWDLSPSQA
jgi:hypothetical protein